MLVRALAIGAIPSVASIADQGARVKLKMDIHR